MKHLSKYFLMSSLVLWTLLSFGQNPIITDQFTADPSARVFGDRIYLYPSHDILANEERGREGWFCMEDYHVFSSSDLSDWTDHGVIVSQDKVDWVRPESYAMWAPDCIEKNGKYYFYFPAPAKDTAYGRGFSIGLAVAEQPAGPYIPEPEPIIGVHGIDPCPFIDKDGQAYLYWSMGNIYVARLNADMTGLASEPAVIENLPEKGLKEGPFVFERNGIYYLTYPHVENNTERLEYATGDNPMGPFKVAGVIMDESPTGCWTNHQSLLEFKDQWYLFYHHNDLSPQFDKSRAVMIDSLFFNADGKIQKVSPTSRGVGLTNASNKIQIDRYSKKSESGTSIAFLDTLNTFMGWKTIMDQKDAWIQYNAVNFESSKVKKVEFKAISPKGCTMQIRIGQADGPLLAEVKIPESEQWITINSKLSNLQTGTHNLVLVLKEDHPLEIDWIRFY